MAQLCVIPTVVICQAPVFTHVQQDCCLSIGTSRILSISSTSSHSSSRSSSTSRSFSGCVSDTHNLSSNNRKGNISFSVGATVSVSVSESVCASGTLVVVNRISISISAKRYEFAMCRMLTDEVPETFHPFLS